MGMLRDGPMSWTHPDPDRFMQGDGKVITPCTEPSEGSGSSTEPPLEVVAVGRRREGEIHATAAKRLQG
jgi:hypothetical protein